MQTHNPFHPKNVGFFPWPVMPTIFIFYSQDSAIGLVYFPDFIIRLYVCISLILLLDFMCVHLRV